LRKFRNRNGIACLEHPKDVLQPFLLRKTVHVPRDGDGARPYARFV
jgi:hypothetical protein